jgi:hypothetical protein
MTSVSECVNEEGMTECGQFRPKLGVVEDLTVEDGPHRLVFIVNGLHAALQIDDAQPRSGEANIPRPTPGGATLVRYTRPSATSRQLPPLWTMSVGIGWSGTILVRSIS